MYESARDQPGGPERNPGPAGVALLGCEARGVAARRGGRAWLSSPESQGAAIPTPQERRWAIRIAFVRHPSARAQGTLKVWLLDLSATGARITLGELLEHGARCTLELPPDLGALTLAARVVWSAIFGGEQTAQGERHIIYQSGLAFVDLTAEQQATLARLLEQLTPKGTLWDGQRSPGNT